MASRKGKREKQSKTPEVSQVDEQQKEKEIVPGKGLYESQWMKLMDKDSTLCCINEIIQEVFESSFAEAYHDACNAESYSHAVNWAKDLMIETIECYFLVSDGGNPSIEGWQEDGEPITSTIDSWARGTMPLVDDEGPQHTGDMTINADTPSIIIPQEVIVTESLTTDSITNKSDSERETTGSSSLNEELPPHHIMMEEKKRRPVNRRKRNLIKIIEESPHETTTDDSKRDSIITESNASTVRSQTPPSPSMRLAATPIIAMPLQPVPKPASRSNTVLNEQGKVLYTTKLNTKRFPLQSVKPHVSVSHQPVTVWNKQRVNRQVTDVSGIPPPLSSHLMMRGHHYKEPLRLVEVPSQQSFKGGIKRIESTRYPKHQPSLPSLVDLIDPLPGVTVREDGRIIKGHVSPRNHAPSPHGHMKPIHPLLLHNNDVTDNILTASNSNSTNTTVK